MNRRGFLGALAALPGLAWLGRERPDRVLWFQHMPTTYSETTIEVPSAICDPEADRVAIERVLRYRKWKRMQREREEAFARDALDRIEAELG